MTLRQIWVRIVALRTMPEFTPLDRVLDEQQQKAEARRAIDDIDTATAMFDRKG